MRLRSTNRQVAGNVDVVDPDILRSLNGDGITILGENLGNLQVANNDVGLLVDGKADTSKALIESALIFRRSYVRRCKPTSPRRADDGLIGSHRHLSSPRDGAFHDDDSRSISLSGSREGCEARDCCGSTACTTLGTAQGISNGLFISCMLSGTYPPFC